MSTNTAHDAVNRLSRAGKSAPHQRRVDRTALLELLEHGVRYAFPPVVSKRSIRGVPTAHSAPVLASEIVAEDAIVRPNPKGPVVGEAIVRLYERAAELPERCASVYEMPALVDALRSGRARDRKIAAEKLRTRLGCTSRTPVDAGDR